MYIYLLKACCNASTLLISKEKISLPAIEVKGVSEPSSCAKASARAVFPVPGLPAIRIALPAIFSCFIIRRITPKAFLAAC